MRGHSAFRCPSAEALLRYQVADTARDRAVLSFGTQCLHNVYTTTPSDNGIDLGYPTICHNSDINQQRPMYARTLRKAEQERRFSIVDAGTAGWEVRHELDRRVVKRVLYDDWHRVERARMAIAQEAETLKDAGWNEL